MNVRVGSYQLRVIDSMNFGVEKLATVEKGKMVGQEYVSTCNYFPDFSGAFKFFIGCLEKEAFKYTSDLDDFMTKYSELLETTFKRMEGYEKTSNDS